MIQSVCGADVLYYSLLCTDKIERTIPRTDGATAFISETFYYPPQVTSVRLEEKLANDYMLQGGEELERDQEGGVVWSRDRFMGGLRE